MTSVKCPECNLTNWATAINCKRCGCFLQPLDDAAAQGQPQAAESDFNGQEFDGNSMQVPFVENPPFDRRASRQNSPNNFPPNFNQPNSQPNYYRQNYQQPPQKSGMAIASMVIGIIGCFLAAPVGLILGIVSLKRANNRPFEYGGKGFAIAGIVLNSLGFITIPIIAAIAIPNLLAARRSANEASAISIIRTLSAAEQTYAATAGAGRCGDLQQLAAAQLIDAATGAGQKNGYRFMVTNLPIVGGGCEIHATPVSTSSGTRSFYFSTEDGEIRAANKNGKFAAKSDAPLGQGNSFSNSGPASDSSSSSASSPYQNDAIDEMKTIATLRTLSSAETTYAATAGQGKCGTLQSLAAQRLIGSNLTGGQKDGYILQVNSAAPKSPGSLYTGCEIRATPVSGGGTRSFFVGDDGVIRGANKNGEMANKNDPAIDY